MEKVGLVWYLLLAVVTVSRGQDGCPVLAPGTIGICSELCTDDGDCTRGQKCCSNGCGHQCTACVPVTCDKPGCHVEKDSNNCDYCKCENSSTTCDDMDCPEGFRCILQEVKCIKAPCPPVPQCVECPQVTCRPECRLRKGDDGCETCDCHNICPAIACVPWCRAKKDSRGCLVCDCQDPCPDIVCPPECKMKKDINGCNMCDCQDPCQNMKCKEGQVCELRTMPCLMPPCPRQAVCVDDRRCPLIRCTPGCPPRKDPDGCDFCDCSDPCQRCNPDQTCEVYHVPCIRPPCPPPFKVCKDKPRCPSVLCTPECPPNKGPDGCDFCDCGDPCQECRPDQSCELLYPPCFGGDCRPPMGICKDLPKPPTDRRCSAKPRLTSCSYRFRFRYIYDVDYGTCRRLRRRTCSSSLNKFRTMRACLQACEAPPPPPPLIIDPPQPVDGRPGDNVQVGGWPSMLDHFGRRT